MQGPTSLQRNRAAQPCLPSAFLSTSHSSLPSTQSTKAAHGLLALHQTHKGGSYPGNLAGVVSCVCHTLAPNIPLDNSLTSIKSLPQSTLSPRPVMPIFIKTATCLPSSYTLNLFTLFNMFLSWHLQSLTY